jgi:hypothetical protein
MGREFGYHGWMLNEAGVARIKLGGCRCRRRRPDAVILAPIDLELTPTRMGYLGEDLSIPQLLFALNAKLSQQVRPFECVPCVLL